MSGLKCGLIWLSAMILAGNSFKSLAQQPSVDPAPQPQFAAKLAEVLVGRPSAAATFFKHPNEKKAQPENSDQILAQLLAPCTNGEPIIPGTSANCDGASDPDCPCQSSAQSAKPENHGRCDCPTCAGRVDTSEPIHSSRLDTTAYYCEQMSRLLAVTMQNENADVQTRQQAIHAAMLMVARSAEANAEAKIAKLEAAHQETISRMQVQLNELASQSDAADQMRDWLSPIYANQNRNYQQMQLVSANNATMNRTLALLEKHVELANSNQSSQTIRNHTIAKADYVTSESLDSIPQIAVSRNNAAKSNSVKTDADNEILRLQSQLIDLQNRLDELQNSSVRPAGHLEPVFTPDQPLQPLPLPLYGR